MKIVILGFTALFSFTALAQTPYLSVLVKMDSAKAEGTRYKLEMKICEPKETTERGDWFSSDTSKIDFNSLKPGDIDCGEYFESEKPYQAKDPVFNQFKHGSHNFAWEKILVLKISNWSSRGWWPEMYIVMPVKYKSFVTYIKLDDLEFQSGQVMFLSDFKMKKEGMSVSIEESLKNLKTEEITKFSLRELLEEK